MSLIAVTAAVARVAAEVPGVKASYTAAPNNEPGVLRLSGDITDAPVTISRYLNFEMEAGTPEVLTHYILVEFWVRGRSEAEAEAEFLPLVFGFIAQMRSRVGLFGKAKPHGKVQRGGPPRPEQVQAQPFIVFPVTVQVKELTPQTYELGPES